MTVKTQTMMNTIIYFRYITVEQFAIQHTCNDRPNSLVLITACGFDIQTFFAFTMNGFQLAYISKLTICFGF